MAKPVIRYKVIAHDSQLAGRMIYVPQVVDRTEPQTLAYLVEKAIDTGRIAGLKPSAATGIAEAVAEMIAATLREGEGVKFGDYFTVRMYLDGTVDGPLASLGAANNINAKIITGSKLKISRDMFSFRNVNATGDDPFIDEVQSDVDGAVNGIVRLGDPLAVIGSFLQLGADDVVNVYRKAAGSQETVSCGSVAADALTTNSNKLLRFPFAAIPLGGEMRDGDALFFEVSKQVTLPGGQTATQLSNRFTATATGTAPVPGPSVTAVWSDYSEELPEGYDEDAVVVEDMPIHVRGANLDGATVQLVSSGGASTTLTYDPDMSSEGVWAFQPTSGNFTNPCAIVVTSDAGTANFGVKYYKPE